MQQPPQPPPSDPPPTDPTRRIPAAGETPVAREAAPPSARSCYDSELVERIDRARFWANFGAAAATLAAILGVIALIVALQAKDDANAGQQRRPAARGRLSSRATCRR